MLDNTAYLVNVGHVQQLLRQPETLTGGEFYVPLTPYYKLAIVSTSSPVREYVCCEYCQMRNAVDANTPYCMGCGAPLGDL